AMATGAVFGEQFRALGERIVAQEGDRAFARDAAGGLGEDLDAFGVAPGFFNGGLVSGVALVLGHGEESQEDDSGQKRAGQTDVEMMAQPPPADDGHEEDDQHDETGDDDGAPDLRAAREELEELEQE